jgi:hypothetical protein
MKKITRVGTLVLMALSVVLMIGCEKNETIIINAPNNNGGPGNGNGGNGGVVDSSTMCATLPWYTWQEDQVPVFVWEPSWINTSNGTTQFDWDGDRCAEVDSRTHQPYTAPIPSGLASTTLDSLASNPFNPGYFSMGRKLEIKSAYCADEKLSFAIINALRTIQPDSTARFVPEAQRYIIVTDKHGVTKMVRVQDDVFVKVSKGETPWMKK